MAAEPREGIVRILMPNRQTAGTGFLLHSDGLIVTCAHVIAAAGTGPGGQVEFVWHQTQEVGSALVDRDMWRDPLGEDVAILRVGKNNIPASTSPLALEPARPITPGLSHQRHLTFGFPQAKPVEGLPGLCEIVDHTTRNNYPILTLRSSEVSTGFSGAPVWHPLRKQVIGMVVSILAADEHGKQNETAFIIPSETIQAICPSVSLVASPLDVDIWQQYAAGRQLLAHHIPAQEFQAHIKERTRNFVGRDFIFTAIDDHIQDTDFPSGYIIIQGEPGIGKTALMGELVNRRGYVHHFNIAPQNIRSPQAFLNNICAQLIVRYHLNYPALPPDAAQNSKFLSQLLAEVAAQPQNLPLVVLIDALDEAEDSGLAPQANRLYLPPSLPAGVFFVVTTRPQYTFRLDLSCPPEPIYIDENDPHNLRDVQQYIQEFIDRYPEEMVARIAEWKVERDEFVHTLTEKSEGNFMYLVHVLHDIRKQRLTVANVDNIRNLPKGLKEYYLRHWRTTEEQEQERFKQYYKPVICILAAAREPVDMAHLMEWTKLPSGEIRNVIHIWTEFLNEDPSPTGEPLYRIYHASFQDFLWEEVGLKDYHNIIAENALKKIPGFLDRK